MGGIHDTDDAVFSALSAPPSAHDPHRLELYLARVAIDHGQRALAALRLGDEPVFSAHLLAYGRLARGLIETGYWDYDAATQVSVYNGTGA